MRSFHRFMALAAFPALLAYAQDISGDWQGTLKAGAQELRILLQIAKSDNGQWRATMLSIDQSPDRGAGTPVISFSLDGSNIHFAIGAVQGSYDGKLSADGASISGTWMACLRRPCSPSWRDREAGADTAFRARTGRSEPRAGPGEGG
jgi:hypothetical protein